MSIEELTEICSPLTPLVVFSEYLNLIKNTLIMGRVLLVYQTKVDDVPIGIIHNLNEWKHFTGI